MRNKDIFKDKPFGTKCVTNDGTNVVYISEEPGYAYLCVDETTDMIYVYHSTGVDLIGWETSPKTIKIIDNETVSI